MRRLLLCLILSLALAGSLAACGKKGPPHPPDDEPQTHPYPRIYPTR